jgi:signal transduction histidine kinase
VKSAVVAWALFCLLLIPPSAFLGTLAFAAGNEELERREHMAFSDRLEAAIRLRTAIDTATANGGAALASLPENASLEDARTAMMAATSANPFGVAFTYQNGTAMVISAGSNDRDAGDVDNQLEQARKFLEKDPVIRALAHDRWSLIGQRGLTFSSSDLNVLNVKKLSSGVEVGWLVDAATIMRGAAETLPPDYVLERDPDEDAVVANSTMTVVQDDRDRVTPPIGTITRKLSKTAPTISQPPPRTKEALTKITLGKALSFHVAEKDPAALDARARRARQRILAISFACITLFIAVAAAFFKRARNAQRLADLRTDFVAAVSHELRTPLASVRMFAELLEAGDVPEDERAEVEQALAGETRRLHATLDRMLRYGALARGKLVLAKQVQRLEPIAKEAAGKRNVTLDVPEDLEANVDSGMLTLAIDNLLSNAVKYAPEGGPYVVRARAQENHIVLSVTDRGPGLSKKAQEKVFLPFERADQRLSQATEGSGVGLALVRGIARAHGGDASVASEPGQGATFTLRLPRT